MTNQDESVPLTIDMKLASRKIHNLANASVNLKLVVLLSDKLLYAKAIAGFFPVFKTLEENAKKSALHGELKYVQPLLPALERATALSHDLKHYLGDAALDTIKEQTTPAVQAYVTHLQSLHARDPGMLLAHVWTQYSALTSGGQAIRKMVVKAFQEKEERGVALFDFSQHPGIKSALRKAVDDAGDTMTAERRQAVIEEHIRVFELNNAIVREFQVDTRHWLAAIQRLLPGVVSVAFALVMCMVTLYIGGCLLYGRGWVMQAVGASVGACTWYLQSVVKLALLRLRQDGQQVVDLMMGRSNKSIADALFGTANPQWINAEL